VDRIEPYGDGKFKLIFSEKAKPIGPIPFGSAPSGWMQGPRYTTFVRLIAAKSLADLVEGQRWFSRMENLLISAVVVLRGALSPRPSWSAARAGEVEDIEGKEGAIVGDTATASARIRTSRAGELRASFTLVRR
jgi:hypothetical protein